MTQKTFVLGLGAPKAGTTWLYRYISAAPASNMGCRKEYRVLPAMFSDIPLKSKFNFRRLFRLRYGILPVPDRSQALRLRMLTQAGFYERYFAGLVEGDAWLTGDISPGYMKLSADALRRATTRLQSAGFHVKAIFLMRDPVERCWSGARMRKRNQVPGFTDISDEDAVRKIYADPKVAGLCRYDRTLSVLDEVFDPEQVFVGLYEEFFTKAELERLSRFIGIETRPEALRLVFNKTHRDGNLPLELVNEIKAHFAPVYETCHVRFPQTRELWT